MNGLIEGAITALLGNLLTELAGSVRRRLSGDPVHRALKAALSEALEAALEEAGLSPEEFDHFESFFKDLFKEEAVFAELAQLLDPRPDRSLDFQKLAAELEEAGLDTTTLPGFDLEAFLRNFAVAFYSAAGRQEALRGILDLKLLGQITVGVKTIAVWSERGARASERTADGVERLTGEVEELNGKIQRFLEGGVSEAGLRGAVFALQAAGLVPAFDGWRIVESTLLKSGYDIDIDKEGRLRIAGQPSEEKALPPAQLDTLRTVALDLRQAIAARSPSEADLDALAERYRQHIIRWFQNLTFHGMTPSARAIELPLEEVYVELRAVAEVPEAADSFSVEERRLLLEAEEKAPEVKRELLSQLDAFRRERWGRTLPERKSIAAALYQRDRHAFVILGDPGSGKSTLLHFLALVHARGQETASKRLEIDPSEADRLPILVPLAAFDDMLRETPGLTLLDFLPRFYDRRRGLPGLGPLFRRALETGRALVLLDGLDEVLDTATRGYVAQQAGALIGEWSPRGVRFAVSSRFVGYREAPVTGNLPTLSVLDFGEKEIEVFVHRWSHAYEKWSAGGEETPEMLRKARELERDLVEDVRSNESVRRLAANPLMITLLALLRRQVGRLPHRRVQLYEAYVSTMLDNWIEARSQGARERSIPALDRHQAENILIPLALWLQREKPSGTASGAELERQLTEICLGEKGATRENATVPQLREAEEHARRFLKEMRETTGLLIARGHDAFGFLHLTFQEYFAGRALALLDPEERWRMLRPHLHDSRWREPILLCAGRLGVVENRRKDVTDLVRRILEHEDPAEQHLYRNLLLALAIACDDVNLDRQLLEDLLDAAVPSLSSEVDALRTQILGHLAQLAAEGETGALLNRCFAAVWRSGDQSFQRLAVRALGRFGENQEIRDTLLSKLGDQDDRIRAAVVDSLGSVTDKDSRVRSVLLTRLKDQSELVRIAAVRSLAGLLAEDEEVRVAVFDSLDDPSISVAVEAKRNLLPHVSAIRAALLSKMANVGNLRRRSVVIDLVSPLLAGDEELQSQVVSWLDGDQITSYEDREAVLRALSSLVAERPDLLAIVLRAAKDSNLRLNILIGLEPVLGQVEQARAFALTCLHDEWYYVRISAIGVLSRLVGSDQAVRDAVFERLTDSSERVRNSALEAVAPHSDLPQIRATLRELASSESWYSRQAIAKLIGEGSISDDSALLRSILDDANALEASEFLTRSLDAIAGLPGEREFLLACLNDQRKFVKFAAAQSLVKRWRLDFTVHAALVQLLNDEGPNAWAALAPLVEENQVIRAKILDRINDPDAEVRWAAVSALESSVGKDRTIDTAILARTNDDIDSVREVTARVLVPLLSKNRKARRAVLKLLADPSPSVRVTAARALSGLAEEDQEVQSAILRGLEVEPAISRGAFIQALSNLAGSNLEIRGRILRELRDEDSPIRSSAIIALGGVAAEDEDIRNLILDQITSPDENVRGFAVRALSPLAGTSAEVKAAILARLDDSWFFVRLEAVEALATLEPVQPQEGDLWTRLEPWIAADAGYVPPAGAALASVFGTRLPTDQGLRERLVAQLQSFRWSARLGALLALTAWPEGPPDEIVERIFQALRDQRGLESYPARLMAASFLINRNEEAKASIDLCLEALDYGTQPWEYLLNSHKIRKQSALILGTLEPLEHNQRVYDRLLRVMREDEDSDVRDAAYNALVRLAGVRDRQAAVA